MHRLYQSLVVIAVLVTQSACTMNTLPRNMSLKAFDPHRKDFVCKHEADAVPPIDPQAEQWLWEGLAATSAELWPEERDYKKALDLWTRAAERKHWKATLNLASLYAQGQGVARDTERAVQIVEAAMQLGIPGAYDLMGTYHMEGLGVKQDASRAYAFWELAADMGSASAMAYIGTHLLGAYDNPSTSMWSNQLIGIKMLECGLAQSNGKAAYELGTWISNVGIDQKPDHARALRVLHEGVKFGSFKAAGYLFSTFNSGDPMANGIKDRARAERYLVLSDALRRNPDLILPNLDKVLPLPPAQLPKWDGNKQTLIDAAKALVPASVIEPTPGSERTGRANIPDGYVLPDHPKAPPNESLSDDPWFATVPAQHERSIARFSGYWLAQILRPTEPSHAAWDRAQLPQRFAQSEPLPDHRTSMGPMYALVRVMWHYLGVPVRRAAPSVHPHIAQGIARASRIATPDLRCPGHHPCPRTGIWHAYTATEHPHAKVFCHWAHQAYVEKGQRFPSPAQRHLDIAPSEVSWFWIDNANVVGFGSFPDVSLSDLHDAKGKPIA